MDASASQPDVKIIRYDPTPSSRATTPSVASTPAPASAPKPKRVVTATAKWNFELSDFGDVYQRALADHLSGCVSEQEIEIPPAKRELAIQQIRAKISGYRSQDQLKGIYDESRFVTFEHVVECMRSCALQCFYCKEGVQIVYEFVREPKQWSLERIDNAYGHNCDNVVIACLSCNLRRRTMHYERYVTTKQMQYVKKV